MSYYQEEDLRDFYKYSKDYIKELSEQDKEDTEGLQKLKDLLRILEVMYFGAMVFETYIKEYSAHDYLMSRDLTQLPLHINDEGLLSKVIITWRLERNK